MKAHCLAGLAKKNRDILHDFHHNLSACQKKKADPLHPLCLDFPKCIVIVLFARRATEAKKFQRWIFHLPTDQVAENNSSYNISPGYPALPRTRCLHHLHYCLEMETKS